MSGRGFWSYVHADDRVEGERIRQLAADIKGQYEMMTGEAIEVFLDRDAIDWGERWRDQIDESLSNVAFFIPVLTPRYFLSAECRRELSFFANAARNLGVLDLVLPVLYIDVPAFQDGDSGDELIELVKTFQWVDWTELRFEDRTSGSYRRAVARLARRLIEANARADELAAAEPTPDEEPYGTDGDGGEPGLLDRMAEAEESLPRVTEAASAIGTALNELSEVVSRADEQIRRADAQGKGFTFRRLVSRGLAESLRPIAERILRASNGFAAELRSVDSGFRAVIEQVPTDLASGQASIRDVCTFFAMIQGLHQAASESAAQIRRLVTVIEPLEGVSRDLRQPLRTLRKGLTIFSEGDEVIGELVRLIEATGVDCSTVPTERTGAP